MKKFLAILVFCPTLVFAQHLHYPHHHHRPHWRYEHNTWNWVAPVILGGIIVHEITRQQTPTNPPLQENCTPWREIQTPDGRVYRERTCTQ